MSLNNIRKRLKVIEDYLTGEVGENPFGEKTPEVLLQVYIEELDNIFSADTVDDINYEEFLTHEELKERLSEAQLPPKLRHDITQQVSNEGLMNDDTLQALLKHLKGEK